MSIFQRLKTIFVADTNAALDKAEDPAVMEQQAIRDLQEKLNKGVQAEVQLKSLIIEKQKLFFQHEEEAKNWGDKANKLLDQVSPGSLTQEEADKFASEALDEQSKAQHVADTLNKEVEIQQKNLNALSEKVTGLKTDIENIQNKLSDVKSREVVAKIKIEINQQLSNIGTPNYAHELIDNIEEKVKHIENEAKAMDDLQNENKTEKQKIEEILSKSKNKDSENALNELKKQRELKK